MMLKIKDLSAYYIDEKEQTAIAALNNINVDIRLGKTTVIIGASGCGKTTFLRVLSGLTPYSEGVITYDDIDLTTMDDLRKQMSYVTQNAQLYPHLTIFENIAFPLVQSSVPIDEIKNRVNDIANMCDITFLLSRKPKQLSGGQQQKVAIAKAIIKRPQILLLDEPFSNIDDKQKSDIIELLMNIKQRFSMTMIIVTHQLNDVLSLKDDLLMMSNGRFDSIIRGL